MVLYESAACATTPTPVRTRPVTDRRLGATFGLLLAFSAPAAQAEEPTSSTQSLVASLQKAINDVDPVFARFAVAPVAQVLFWDMAFWDNGRSWVTGAATQNDTLYTVGADGQLLVWGQGALADRHSLGGPISSVLAHDEALYVVMADGQIRAFDPKEGRADPPLAGLEGSPTALALADGPTLVAGTEEGRVLAASVPGGAVDVLFQSPGEAVTALSTHGSTIAFSMGDEIRLTRVEKGTKSVLLSGIEDEVTALAYSGEGWLSAGLADGRLVLFAPDSTEASQTIEGRDAPVALMFSSEHRLLVGGAGRVEVLERKDTESPFIWTRAIEAKTSGMVSVGSTLYTLRDQGQIRSHDLETGRPLATLEGHATEISLPIIVVWLVVGAVFFTLRFSFINLRAFGHAIAVTRGKYDTDHDDGDVSHFQALAMALSATVGLGNIAGVAVAVSAGGPGAVLWMIVAGFLGMSSKFAECTLGQMYRTTDPQGRVSGGPMHYLRTGLAELGLGGFGRILSTLFALLCIMGSLGGGNMFQANQSYAQVANVVPALDNELGSLLYGLILSGLVGVVIIGGIHRIGSVASFIVPFMVGIYLLAAFFIVISNADQIIPSFGKIVSGAFSPEAAYGGVLGVIITGFRRAAFSNEAGVGSAAIAHSAAATKEPIREGIVALLEPFIDTVVVCTTTALVLVMTGAYESGGNGVVMTSSAFATVIPWFPKLLTVAVFLFAFSTMISWSYYGERCWTFLFGQGSALIYRVIFVSAVVLGSVVKLGSVLDFSDLMILAMAFPNILGVVLLSGKVRAHLNDYMARLKSGAMVPTVK